MRAFVVIVNPSRSVLHPQLRRSDRVHIEVSVPSPAPCKSRSSDDDRSLSGKQLRRRPHQCPPDAQITPLRLLSPEARDGLMA